MGHEPVYRGILALDVEHFTRMAWTDPIRVQVRARLHRLLDHALAAAHVDPAQAHWGDTGDGVLLLAAAEVPTTRLLHPLVPAFADELALDNRRAPAAERLRLRLVVHAGEVIADPYGHTGQALNHAARLLNAQVGRAILAAVPDTDVVVLVSDQVHEAVVHHGYEGIQPAHYQPVWVTEKETRARAWAHLPRRSEQPNLARLPKLAAAPRTGPPTQATLRELPRHVQEFTGRQEEVEWVLRAVQEPGDTGTAVVLAIDGMGGIGKSALAVYAAHRLANAFPDGQLYLDLRGATPGMTPLEPLAALNRLLQSLGVPADQIAADVDVAAARWRSVTADRRLLLVLDNAASAAQVAALLPASAGCTVLVTSRRVLSTLGGARYLHLDTLAPAVAVELLAKLAGAERVQAEPAEAVEVARLCGYLPLAVRLAGARAARRPTWPLRALVDRLTELRRLDELRDEHVGVRASMQVSYQELEGSDDSVDQQAAQAFRLLAVVDTPDLGIGIAARLLDQPESDAEWVLERLVDAQLLQTPSPGRYRLHDLLRLYARELALRHDAEPVRVAALARVLAAYLATARQVSHLVQPADRRRAGSEADRAGALPLQDRTGALGWLEAEQANLLAVAQQAAGLPDQLAATTVPLAQAVLWGMEIRAQYYDWQVLVRVAMPVAQRLGDRYGRAYLLTDLGQASWRLAQFDAAGAALAQALELFDALEDCAGQGRALNGIGVVQQRQGRLEAARTSLEWALELQRGCGDRHGEAGVLGNLGVFWQELGELPAATGYHDQALALMREIGDRQGEGVVLTNLAEISVERGDWQAAISSCEQAIAIAAELGERNVEAYARTTRGQAYRSAGDPASAAADQEAALAIVRASGDRYVEATVLWQLGLTLRDLGQHQRAQACWKDALAILEEFGSPQAGEVRRLLEDAGEAGAKPA